MAETFLERIVAATLAELAERQARIPLDELRARRICAPATRIRRRAAPHTRPGAGRLE